MGGLLDKANNAKEAELVTEPEPVSSAASGAKAASSNVKATPVASSGSGDADKALKVSLAGWVTILIGALLSLQGGSWGFIIVSVVLIVGIGAIVQADRMRGSVSKPKLYASIFVAILIASTPYAAVMLVPTNATMAITEVELNEETNELSFKVRGTMSSVDVSIEANGEEKWTDSGDVSNDVKKFKVGLLEFFAGNGEDYAGNEVVEYVIKGTGSNGQTGEIKIPSRFTTREAKDAGVRIAPLGDSNDADEYVGITIEVLVGLLNPNEDAEDGGGFTAVGLRPMYGDYEIQVTVTGGIAWSESTITVDGNLATWAPQGGGTGSASTAGWFGLTGSGVDSGSGAYYLDKSKFYDEVGCYSFTVDITNTLGESYSSEFSWEIDLSSGDQNPSGNQEPSSKGYGVGQTC